MLEERFAYHVPAASADFSAPVKCQTRRHQRSWDHAFFLIILRIHTKTCGSENLTAHIYTMCAELQRQPAACNLPRSVSRRHSTIEPMAARRA